MESRDAATSALADGLTDWVLIALGAANAANFSGQALLSVLPGDSQRRCFVLDTIHPSAIRRLESEIDLQRALFILVSKAGDRLEENAIFLYFRHRPQLVQSRPAPRHFISSANAGSYIAFVGRQYDFRVSLQNPPGMIGSHAGCLNFGSMLTALTQYDPEEILSSTGEMRRACSISAESNPAFQLAAYLSAAVLTHRPYLIFFASPSLIPFTYRLSRLIAGSLGMEGAGLVPVAGDVPKVSEGFEESAAFVILTRPQEAPAELLDLASRYRSQGIPFVHVQLSCPSDFLAEMYKWEIATTLAGAHLRIDPFDWPEAAHARRMAMDLLDKLSPTNDTLWRQPRIQDNGIQLFADGDIRRELSRLNLTESLCSFLQLRKPGGFVALFVFLEANGETNTALAEIRRKLSERLGLPVLLLYGPGVVEHYAHLLRNSTPRGLYLMITGDSAVDVRVPGATYTFGQLHHALALGEFEALASCGRSVIRLHLQDDPLAGLMTLSRMLEQAVKTVMVGS